MTGAATRKLNMMFAHMSSVFILVLWYLTFVVLPVVGLVSLMLVFCDKGNSAGRKIWLKIFLASVISLALILLFVRFGMGVSIF